MHKIPFASDGLFLTPAFWSVSSKCSLQTPWSSRLRGESEGAQSVPLGGTCTLITREGNRTRGTHYPRQMAEELHGKNKGGKEKGLSLLFPIPAEGRAGSEQPSSPHLRSSFAFSSALVSFQASSSGLLRAVGFMWSRTALSLPCFQSS